MNSVMGLIKNSVFAKGCMIAMIALSILFGSRRSLLKLVAQTETIFYQGYENDGFGVGSDIERSLEITSNLLVIGNHAFGDNKTQTMQSLELQLEKTKESEDASEILKEFKELTGYLEPYYQELSAAQLSDYDRKQCDKLFRDIEENMKRISLDPYQEAAREFNEKLNHFPANILKIAAGVGRMEEW